MYLKIKVSNIKIKLGRLLGKFINTTSPGSTASDGIFGDFVDNWKFWKIAGIKEKDRRGKRNYQTLKDTDAVVECY